MRLAYWMLWFIALYPPVTAAFWIVGGLVFRMREEQGQLEPPDGAWPPLTVFIPAYNEERVIGTCVRSALALDYPDLRVVVLDDGSSDDTVGAAMRAGGGDPRLHVVRDSENLGKAERLNRGFRAARTRLVLTIDADTHVQRLAAKLLVTRLRRSPLNAAVAGAPHVTNRTNLLCVMQVLEAASIIGLIRRTGSLRGRVGTVAGVLALLDCERVLAVGGYSGAMATEDIDLTWRLLLRGWHTVYEPGALIGMQVPSTLSALWRQRARWARGQGEVLHAHSAAVLRASALWAIALESVASLIWVVAWALALLLAAIELFVPSWRTIFGFAIAWGISIAIVCLLQLLVALLIDEPHDSRSLRAFLLGPLYPLFFWIVSALAALHSEVPAIVRGPSQEHVVWNIPREEAEGELS